MLKSLFFILGSMVSNRVLTSLLHNTAQPMARNLIRKGVKFTARVFTICLIGALTFVAGLVMGVMDMANQLNTNGYLSMSAFLWFGLGLLAFGSSLVYVGAYSDLLSPWRKMCKQDRQEASREDRVMNQFIDGLTAWTQDRSRSHSARSKTSSKYSEYDSVVH